MSAIPQAIPLPSADAHGTVPLTKFRAPRVRKDVLARPPLLERLDRSIADNPVTLVCAPGGSGKTTLLAQWMSQVDARTVALWVGIDADDNDTHRLCAALIQALEPLKLIWAIDRDALLANVAGSGPQRRAALAAMVNALCTTSVERVVLVLDDLHRIENPEAFELLDSLIERLPDHVAVVLGSRVEPPLSLARWRVHGELGVFAPDDLRFSTDDAAALAQARFGDAMDETSVREALVRTRGWAAGLLLMLQSRAGRMTVTERHAADAGESNRHLFGYFAQEVLEDLPPHLQDFVLRSSILIELSPPMCELLTHRVDARQVLDSLYRRNLFLTAVDELTPVLRFHDMFREFLEDELARRDPELKRELHERAAAAETIDSRAIYHLLAAQRWEEAMARIERAGKERIAHGGIATVERWIDALPPEIRMDSAAIGYLRGTCAWFRWDWPRTKTELVRAVDGPQGNVADSERVTALFHLIDALNSSGSVEAARVRVEQAARQPLDLQGRAELALQQAWCAAPSGEIDDVVRYSREFIDIVEADPVTICAATADRIHCVIIGIPGISATFERFYTLFQQVRGPTPLPWHISALTVGAWAHLWRGRREALLATLEQAEKLQHQFGGVRLATERLGQLKGISSILTGQYDSGLALFRKHIQGMQAAELAGHSVVWLRAYRHAYARALWIKGDEEGFRELLPLLTSPVMPGEWPFVATAMALVQGLDAMFQKDWRRAETALRESLRTHGRYRMPMIFGDPRINLAYVLLMQGRKADAWTQFAPVYEEVMSEHALGLLLLEAAWVVDALLDIVPVSSQVGAEHIALVAERRRWLELGGPQESATAAAVSGALAVLSEREYEVLAEVATGASNKHIARQLELSLHTVKRHIANILDKLDCDSRGQAAEAFRRATQT
jgi:LuxR family maltose regulon positive regulatory protein